MQSQILRDFQEACKRTRNPNLTTEEYLLNGTMGLAGEAAETLEVIFRHHNNLQDTVTRDLLIKELGDVAWYCADLTTTLEENLDTMVKFDLQHVAEPWRNRERDAEGFGIHLAISGGKALEAVKKFVFHKKGGPAPTIRESIGQMLFYTTLIGATVDFNLQYVLQTNVDKLKARYPDGFHAALK
jgi:NTP pyrophosphatase (non-canonical NTP hydrolase)